MTSEDTGWEISLDHPLVCVVGPTASGKTSLAVEIAHRLGESGQLCEIINADTYQMYRGMDIGTAKASLSEREGIPHHLIDIVEPDVTVSVAEYQRLARDIIVDCAARGVRPLLVGGSGLYVRAVYDDMRFCGTDQALREQLERRAQTKGADALYRELLECDPEAASHMDARNVRRTVRALEVIAITGQKFSSFLPRYRYVVPTVQVGLDADRQTLDARIARRTEKMRDDGLVEEVRAIRPTLGQTAAKALGYADIIGYLDGKASLDEAFANIAQKTKRLARKQMGWFGRDPRIHWLGASDPHLCQKALEIIDHADRGDFHACDDGVRESTQHHLGDVL